MVAREVVEGCVGLFAGIATPGAIRLQNSRGAKYRDGGAVGKLLERHLHRHADLGVRGIAVHQVARYTHAFLQVDPGHDQRQPPLVTGVIDALQACVAVQGAAARHHAPGDIRAAAVLAAFLHRIHPPTAVAAALHAQFAGAGAIEKRLIILVGLRQPAGCFTHGSSPQAASGDSIRVA